VTKKIILPGRELSWSRSRSRASRTSWSSARTPQALPRAGGRRRCTAPEHRLPAQFRRGSRGVRRGTGFAIDLPVYENDVLNALARTGASLGRCRQRNRRRTCLFQGDKGRDDMMKQLETAPPGSDPLAALARAGFAFRSLPSRQRPEVKPEDVILQTGDIVFIEAREADVFYTGGLLPPRVRPAARQRSGRGGGDLARRRSINSSGINTANINGTLINPGLGFPRRRW